MAPVHTDIIAALDSDNKEAICTVLLGVNRNGMEYCASDNGDIDETEGYGRAGVIPPLLKAMARFIGSMGSTG